MLTNSIIPMERQRITLPGRWRSTL